MCLKYILKTFEMWIKIVKNEQDKKTSERPFRCFSSSYGTKWVQMIKRIADLRNKTMKSIRKQVKWSFHRKIAFLNFHFLISSPQSKKLQFIMRVLNVVPLKAEALINPCAIHIWSHRWRISLVEITYSAFHPQNAFLRDFGPIIFEP